MTTVTQKIKKIIQILSDKDGTSSYPPYVNFSNDIVIPFPGIVSNSMLYCFSIESDYQKLQEMCDIRLNFAPNSQKTKYFPLVKQVMLIFTKFPAGKTMDPNYLKYGTIDELAVQIFVPVVECKKNRKGEWVAQEIFMLTPYVYVNNDFSLVAGREEMGFPKSIGLIDLPASPNTKENFSMKAYGFQKFDKANPQPADWYTLMSVVQSEGSVKDNAIEKLTGWTGVNEAWSALKDIFTADLKDEQFKIGLEFIINEVEDLFQKHIPMVFLKQFRDAANPSNACYQAITQTNGKIEKLHGGWFLEGDYTLNVFDFDTFPLKDDFGWSSTNQVKHAFWLSCDLIFECGKEAWKA